MLFFYRKSCGTFKMLSYLSDLNSANQGNTDKIGIFLESIFLFLI